MHADGKSTLASVSKWNSGKVNLSEDINAETKRKSKNSDNIGSFERALENIYPVCRKIGFEIAFGRPRLSANIPKWVYLFFKNSKMD